MWTHLGDPRSQERERAVSQRETDVDVKSQATEANVRRTQELLEKTETTKEYIRSTLKAELSKAAALKVELKDKLAQVNKILGE